MVRTTRLLAAVAVVLALPVLAAGPAQAHSGLVSSDPANGASLTTPPERITLTFDEDVLAGGADLRATSSRGDVVPLEPPTVAAATVTTLWPASAPAGTYTVAYRVVSADGHPVSDDITFTYLAGAAAGASAAGPSAAGSSAVAPAAAATATSGASAPASAAPVAGPTTGAAAGAAAAVVGAPGAPDSGGFPGWALALVLAVLVGAGIAIAVGLRRGSAAADADAEVDSAQPSGRVPLV